MEQRVVERKFVDLEAVDWGLLVDAHCHFYELDPPDHPAGAVLAVSDDLDSFMETWKYALKQYNVIPCAGLHPWSEECTRENAEKVVEAALAVGVKCFGEVGLDRRYAKRSYEELVEAFKVFLEATRDHGLIVNVHALDAWREAFELLVRYDIGKAIIHWYTGPLDLLREIAEQGYYVTVNPMAWRQPKHMKVAEEAPLEAILVETDAPYEYRGERIEPHSLLEAYKAVAKAKQLSLEEVVKAVRRNAEKLGVIDVLSRGL